MTDNIPELYKSTEWSIGSLGLLVLLTGAGYYSKPRDAALLLVLMIAAGSRWWCQRTETWRAGALPPVPALVVVGELAQAAATGLCDVGIDEVGMLCAARFGDVLSGKGRNALLRKSPRGDAAPVPRAGAAAACGAPARGRRALGD